MSHTPGPWEWVQQGGYYDLIGADGTRVHSDGSSAGEYGPDIDVNDVDARLIAAAPELLEACKDLLNLIDEHGTPIMKAHASRLLAARSAVAKAEIKPE